ncbi:MAG: hypothetical protein A2600_09330 [Candidatus Lambdaproteobacteria bacterium RIFOXYD1_FULL_56_27]|uniref:Protein BatD n=1 Tax=Candidatus Lambdaproteobacteria bacterium RIFOXYD2_FULL_56_26 TaxID=1817773 RepID=A0A1F6GUM2_9PROT|nr:MAG: hypothetical protein A2557_04600 [Candidatus Lambdaproteobacteria bacterium RIFOXYD2_FULL_56_26]OGH10024.1 MAG: hypothetical protein A2600_09330 [Candidatus Lambdaproteobacteria bacterium RIFOXYD1_FULL_56_27]
MFSRGFFLGVLWAGLVCPNLFAQVTVSAQIDTEQLVLGDLAHIQVEVEGADGSARLELPAVKGLSLTQTGPPSTSSQTMVVNGQMTQYQAVTFGIGVGAAQPGKYRIPPLVVVFQGQRYPTQEFGLVAKPGDSGGVMTLTLKPNKTKLYLGEELWLTLTWTLTQQVEDYEFRLPLLAQKDDLHLGLLPLDPKTPTQDLSIDAYRVAFNRSPVGMGGVKYQTGFRLSPVQPGTLDLGSAQVKGQITQGFVQAHDFFGRLVQRPQLKAVYATTPPLSVTVLPLPTQGRPADFSGAVGNFAVKALVERQAYQMGEPVELTLVIEGPGNLSKVERPKLRGLEKDFDFQENLEPGTLEGEALRFKQKLKPKAPGTWVIPPLGFSFFNPQTGAYQTAHTNLLTLSVAQGEKLRDDEVWGHLPEPGPVASSVGLLSTEPESQELPVWFWALGLVLLPLGYAVARLQARRPKPVALRVQAPWGPKDLEPLRELPPSEAFSLAQERLSALLAWKFGPQTHLDGDSLDPQTARNIKELQDWIEARLYGSAAELEGEQERLVRELSQLQAELTRPQGAG